MLYMKYSIIGILFSFLFLSGCSGNHAIVDGHEPVEFYYIENNASSEISIFGFRGITFHNYFISPGERIESKDLVDADSAWIFVGESIVNKVYIHEDTERNFLHQENYMVTDVTGKSITFVFYFEDSDIQ